jgi:hypothetical protein
MPAPPPGQLLLLRQRIRTLLLPQLHGRKRAALEAWEPNDSMLQLLPHGLPTAWARAMGAPGHTEHARRCLVGLATLTGDSVLAPEGWDVKRRGSPRKKADSAEEQKLSQEE